MMPIDHDAFIPGTGHRRAPTRPSSVRQRVVKAKADPPVLVFNANGKAIGTVDPDKLLPIADDAESETTGKPAAEPVPTPKDATAGVAKARTRATEDRTLFARMHPEKVVARTIAKSRALHTTRERQIAQRAVDRVNAAVARGDSPAAVAVIRKDAAAIAAAEIRRAQARRR